MGKFSENVCLVFLCIGALSAGIFVTRDECPPNEEYLLCGSACPFNCTDPEGPVTCTEECVEGCFCKSGYLRDVNGTCVSADQCIGGNSTACGPNEEFLTCGSSCPPTCSQPEPNLCIEACAMGCFCKSGYYRDETNMKCVTLNNCTPEQCFNENEVYDICNKTCEPRCDDPEPICTKECASGCVCASGLLRNSENSCVSVDKCPTGNSTDSRILRRYLDAIKAILNLNANADPSGI